MKAKEITFEGMKDLKCGDLIVMEDPLSKQDAAYVLMSITEDSFYFVNGAGASLMVNCQDTIDGFNVKLIDDTHPSWIPELSTHGKQLGEMLDIFKEDDNIGIDQMADKLLKII